MFIAGWFLTPLDSGCCCCFLMLLPSKGASFCKPCFSSNRQAEDSGAANTQNHHLCTVKNGGDFTASWASTVHEIGIGALHQLLLLVCPPLLERDEEIFARSMFSWTGHHHGKELFPFNCVPSLHHNQ